LDKIQLTDGRKVWYCLFRGVRPSVEMPRIMERIHHVSHNGASYKTGNGAAGETSALPQSDVTL